MNNFQDQGRAAYKRDDYNKAIECFSRAIGRGASVQLLDNRAASYEKLGELSAALQDAKAAIQLNREDATGYLRAAKVLRRMEKHAVALDIATHGLKCIKHFGQGYELLRKARQQLMDKLCPPKRVDPLTLLPREIAMMVFEHLDFRQRITACLVSKGWMAFIRSSPDLWRHLDLTGARKKVRSAFVSRAINTAKSRLTSATLNKLHDVDKTLIALNRHCALRELTLLKNGIVSQSASTSIRQARNLRLLDCYEAEFNGGDTVYWIIAGLSDSLESCRFRLPRVPEFPLTAPYPRLRTLSVHATGQQSVADVFSFVKNSAPALRHLVCTAESNRSSVTVDLASCECLRHLEMKTLLEPSTLKSLPASLTTLKITSTMSLGHDMEWNFSGAQNVLDLPCLEELALELPRTLTVGLMLSLLGLMDDALQATTEGSKHLPLRKLSMSNVAAADDIMSLLDHPRLRLLESLHLPRIDGCTDDIATSLVDVQPRVHSMELSGTRVTGVFVKHAVKSGHIDELIMHDCVDLGIDAIEWAREQGVRVQYRLPSAEAKGRKVRY